MGYCANLVIAAPGDLYLSEAGLSGQGQGETAGTRQSEKRFGNPDKEITTVYENAGFILRLKTGMNPA